MDAIKIYEHYGCQEDKKKVESGEYDSVDFLIGKEEDVKELTANMAGFGTKESQMVIIEYDKGYGFFIAKKIPRKYGASADAPSNPRKEEGK